MRFLISMCPSMRHLSMRLLFITSQHVFSHCVLYQYVLSQYVSSQYFVHSACAVSACGPSVYVVTICVVSVCVLPICFSSSAFVVPFVLTVCFYNETSQHVVFSITNLNQYVSNPIWKLWNPKRYIPRFLKSFDIKI